MSQKFWDRLERAGVILVYAIIGALALWVVVAAFLFAR